MGTSFLLLVACGGGSSDSTVTDVSDAAGGGASGSGGDAGSGALLDQYAPPQADSGVIVDPGGSADGGACSPISHLTMGVHVKLSVSWAASAVLVAGSGTTDIWMLASSDTSGTSYKGTVRTCGITLPSVTTSLIAGSKKIQLLFPDIWDSGSMPTFATDGTIAGWNKGDAYTSNAATGALGLAKSSTFANGGTAWPATGSTYPQFQVSDLADDDGDGIPGVTVKPTNGNGYSLVPTSADFINNPTADQVAVVSRNVVALDGKWASCVEVGGDAKVTVFDNHVVACHDATGTNCASSKTGVNAGPGFVDSNRTIYKPGAATFVARRLVDNATCANVRLAVP